VAKRGAHELADPGAFAGLRLPLGASFPFKLDAHIHAGCLLKAIVCLADSGIDAHRKGADQEPGNYKTA